MFDFFSKEDKQLYNMLGHLNMAEKEISLKDNSETEIYFLLIVLRHKKWR